MTADVFLHETGHAIFDMLEIPFLEREEDAADQVSAYMLLQRARDDVRCLIWQLRIWAVKEAGDDEGYVIAKAELRRYPRTPGPALLQRAVHGLRQGS